MAKIKLLLGAGVPYAATTPLWYTLALDNKYCHTGHRKEPRSRFLENSRISYIYIYIYIYPYIRVYI